MIKTTFYHEAGRHAFYKGLSSLDNPYLDDDTENSDQYYDWLVGWLTAQAELQNGSP